MHGLDALQMQTRYNCWMTDQLYDVCAQMSDDERRLDVGAFFRSIHGTLNHILLADRVWLGRLRDTPFPVATLDQTLYADFQVLAHEHRQTAADIEGMVLGMTPDTLDEPLTYLSLSTPTQRTHTRGLILLHLFNHQTHHRGQVTAMVSALGHDFGVTDLIACPSLPPTR